MTEEIQVNEQDELDLEAQEKIFQEEFLKAKELHEQQYKAFKYEIENSFTRAQASIILDIFSGTYQNSTYIQKIEEGLIRAYAALDAIHSVLVSKDIYSSEDYEALFNSSYVNQMKVREEEQEKAMSLLSDSDN